MASKDVDMYQDVDVYQDADYIICSRNIEYPHTKSFSARFTNKGFTVSSDDEIIFECTVCHTIIPEKCELSAEVGWKVKLKKKHSGTWRAIFNDKMKSNFSTKSSLQSVVLNPNFKPDKKSSDVPLYNRGTTNQSSGVEKLEYRGVQEISKVFDGGVAGNPGLSNSKPSIANNQPPVVSSADHFINPSTLSSKPVSKDSGLKFSPPQIKTHEYIIVEFHCLLSAMQWGFDSSSAVFVRFSAPQLGDFKYCYGPMEIISSSEDGLLEFSYAMKVPLQVLREHNAIHRKYKYHVESPLTKSGAVLSLELITGINNARGVIDRCLRLHVDLGLLQNQTKIKHYDGVIWPEIRDMNYAIDSNVGFKEKAKSFFGIFKSQTTLFSSEQGLIDVTKLSQSDHVALRKNTLSIYLNGLQGILCGPESVSDPINIVRTVHAMYSSLHNSYVTYPYYGQQYEDDVRLKETTDVMYEFLTSTAASLANTIIDHPGSSFLVKSLVLLMIFYKCEMISKFVSGKNISSILGVLLKSLAVKDESTCQVISCDFVVHYTKSIVEILGKLISGAIKCIPPITEWIFAVPLLHFVQGNCKPYAQLEGISWDYNDPSKFLWGEFHGILQTIHPNLTDVHFGELQHMFLIDPYLLRFFVFKIDSNYLSSIFEKVPMSILIMRLTRDCLYSIKLHVKQLLPALLTPVSKHSDSVLSEEDIDIIKASLCFLNNAMKVSKERDEAFFVNVIKLVLYGLSRKSFPEDVKSKVIGNLESFLHHISHQLFQSKKFSTNKKFIQLEIQYWNRMIQLECLSSVAVLWGDMVTNIITRRLSGSAKPTQLASILIEMDIAKTPDVLTDCVFDHLLKSTEHTSQQGVELRTLIKELLKLSRVSKRLLTIINASLMKIYPMFAQSKLITIDDLLQWDLWPKILTIYVKGCSAKLADIQERSEIAYSALVVIMQFCRNILIAKICMYDLEKSHKNVEQLRALCSAANSGSTPLIRDFNHVKNAMKICTDKFVYAERFSEKMKIVVKYCNKISKDIAKSISNELNCDLKSKEISSLCVDAQDDTFKCIRFSVDKLPHDMIEYFSMFDHSKLFESIWDDTCGRLDEASITTFDDIHEHVWNHTLAKCKELLHKFYNKSFTYSDIDIKCFAEMRSINNHITTLYNAMYHYNFSLISSFPDPKQWIPQAVKNITMYLEFARHFVQSNNSSVQFNAVQLCLKMKELLRLKGDFSIVDNLNIQIGTSFDQSSFAEVGVDKVEKWLALRDVYGDPIFQKFYRVLSEAMMLIDWLREEIHDCGHLQCFVEVAKSSVKKYNKATQLSNLYDIGMKLAAFIYDVSENLGYNEFYSKCKSVLNILKEHPYLIDNLEKCNHSLDWFKALRSKIGRFDFSSSEPLLYSPPEISSVDYVTIEFYCLLSIERWGFDETSKVYLRFGSPELGTFFTCHGPMTSTQINHKDYQDYQEFHYPIKIPIQSLKDSQTEVHKYKYHVESPATRNGLIKSLEFIVGPDTDGGIIDRYLAVNCRDSELRVGSTYKRFDGIILPEHKIEVQKSGNRSGKDPSKCNGVLLSSFDYYTFDLKSDNHKELRKSSLSMHLQKVHAGLVGEESISDPVSCVEITCAAYLSLHKYYLCYKRHYGYLGCHDWEFHETTKEMETWLILTTYSLTSNIKSQPSKSYLQNILCLLVIYFKIKKLYDFFQKAENATIIGILLRNLAVDSSSVLETKVKNFQINCGQLFLQSFLNFINVVINSHPSLTEWIFAVPIIHLLMGQHKIFNTVGWNENPSNFKYEWGDDWESDDKKKLLWKPLGHEQLHNYIQELQPLFEIDPLLLRLFVKVTAFVDLESLIGKIPSSILLMRLAEECTSVYQEIVKKTVDIMINELKSEEDISTIKASLYLFKTISQKFFKNKSYEALIKPVIKLVLVATSRVCSNSEILGNKLIEVKDNVTSSLKDTLTYVTTTKIKISLFNVQHRAQGKSEIQYWSKMFELECPDDVKELWHSVCKVIMIERLPTLSKPSDIVSIFKNIDFSEAHGMVICCVTNYLIEGVQKLEQKDLDHGGLLTGLQDLVENPEVAENVVSHLNKVLESKYSAPKSVQVQDLLIWDLWPDIIKIFVKGVVTLQSKESLELDDIKDISEIVHSALLRLNKLSVDIKGGAVTGKEVESFRKQISKLQVLYEAANTGNTPLVPQFIEISDAIKVCVEKIEAVKLYRSKLNVVIEYCKCISKDVVQVICRKIDDNSDEKLSNKLICDITETEGNGGSYKCFSSSEVDKEMVGNLIVCGKYNNNGAVNEVFQCCWDQQINLSAIGAVQDVTFDLIFSKVWKPTISQCQSLLCGLMSKTVTLEEVEKLYQINNFSMQLSALCTAVHHCYPESTQSFPPPQEWVPHTEAHIALYFEIVNNPKCTDAANVILKLQKSLKLEGDFKIIEDLAKHMDADFKKKTLIDVNEQLINKWIKITSMYSSGMLNKCLEVFSKNTNLVFWLKKATNGVRQLASFIEVCGSTAGEEEFNMNRLSCLHSVGSNFASLIYELPNDADFDKFDEKCKAILNHLGTNPKLADGLGVCSEHLDWFKELKETQGSFEVTAISKVNDINQWGEYKIVSNEETSLLFIGDAIKLKIHRLNAVKLDYSLDDLRDLESKLVLITGKYAAGKKEIDKFLKYLHLVCRIANSLLALRNAGHAQYITWSYSLHCEFDISSALENQAMKMENELKQWKDEIAKSRNTFHVLNLFTTQQLRVIRQQLGQLNCERISTLPPEVISMFMSLSPKIRGKDIKECLQLVKTKSSLVDQPSLKKSEDSNDLLTHVDYEDNTEIGQFNPEDEVSIVAAIEKLVMRLINQLSDVEKTAYEELKGAYPDEVAYLSIKNCNNANMQQEDLIERASEWCLENQNSYENKDPQAVLNEIQTLNLQNNESTKNEQNVQSESNASPVVESLKEDSVNLMEQMLIENDIPSGLAREAAELYPDDIEEALSYCLIETNKSTEESFVLSTHGSRKNPYEERYDKVKVNEYMDLVSLAKVLDELTKIFPGQLKMPRKFNDSYFNLGEPNLILVPSSKVLKTALSLYCEQNQPFPSMDEIVICASKTATEDIVLLWKRAIWDPGYKQIFCVLFAEQLSYKVCDELLAELEKLSQGKTEYRIVIICSSESEETSHVVSKLLQYKRDYTIFQKDKELAEYLKDHFKTDDPQSAAKVDPERLSVRVVSSGKPGMGKSLHIKKLADKLKDKESYCIVPVHGPVVDFNTVMKLLQPYTPSYESLTPQIIHMDIDSEVLSVIDTVLFSLLILKSLKDENGNVWRLLSSQLYMIEVTYCQHNLNTQQESTLSLLQLLPSIKCAGPEANQSEDVATDKHEFKNKVFQCVFQYLKRFDSRENLSNFTYKEPSVEGNYSVCISTIKNHCKIPHPSWAELAQFVRFLYVQLNDCQKSIYCNEEFFGKGADFKTFIVEFMIRMSQDFAMRSLKIVEDNYAGKDAIDKYKIKEERKWDESQHPYIFFNQDGMTMTFVGFNVDKTGQCSDFKSKKLIEGCQVPVSVCECLATQGVNLQKEDCNKWTKKDMIERLRRVFGVDYAEDPDDSYVLTSDNFLKMMAIHMRFRCDIPVVIMGETGCGKTRLIRYMCDLQTCDTSVNNLLMLKVHGGTSEEDISKAVEDTEDLARCNQQKNPKLYTILFFDEANTTENIGLIKEIMCDRRLKGRQISDNVKFIAACNPYRKHTKEMIKKLEKAGLGYYVKDDNTQQKFGNIPLRHLVYRVLDLPLSMQPLLYDFGQVTGKTEDEYVHQIVTNHVHKNKKISNISGLIDAITILLAASQSFMRKQQDECSFVSLRDVERAMIVFEWFYENNEFFQQLLKKLPEYEETNRETRTMILTLAVCYHARIQEREKFEKEICSNFKPPISEEPISREKFVKEISNFQDMILSQMDSNIPKNIARNVALKENVFMMLVCIELKIPLFVIGKPGSSKSLAKSIIENSMQGSSSSSTNELCKKLKQVKLFSYQCSQHSTPATIIEVFSNAKRFQESKDMKQIISVEKKNTKQFVSVVVLDEVGLAEDSPSLPLKALHPLLEDGTSGADAKVQHIAREHRVAFIGISNWALDPAKMNRGVMITRGSPDEKELEQSARGICSNETNDPVRDKLEMLFGPLSKAYMEICKTQQREFFGLRDFYSLIKMLYWMVSKTNSPLTEKQLIHAIRRNFDGLDKFDATKIFLSHILDTQTATSEPLKVSKQTIYPEYEIIKASLDTKDISWHGESRYLLFMTENFAALRVLQQHLLCDEKEPAFVLFGSSFPKDMEYTQVCRNINQIKICMETGRTVILLNLENLYESLYDVLNQYYTNLQEHRYVDLGLQSHRIKCRVDDKFKMILIAEKERVYKEFPTPLINRLEKHFVDTSTILTKPQKEIVDRLKEWAQDFTTVAKLDNLNKLTVGDAFVGYQEDTPAAVVFQAYHHFKVTKQWKVEDIMSQDQKNEIFAKGKNLLLDIASPDAIVRLQYSKLANEFDEVFDMYFNKQSHSSLFQLLSSKLPASLGEPTTNNADETIHLSAPALKEMLLLQVTTHSHLLSEPDVTQLCKALNLPRKNITHFLLPEFDTEEDFCNKLILVMNQEVVGHKILIIQCDCGHLHSDLIACARYRVIDKVVIPQSEKKAEDTTQAKNEFKGNKKEDTTQAENESKGNKSEDTIQAKNEPDSNNSSKSVCKSTVHVVFIIQLPRLAGGTSFVGFQGGDWLSVHLDDLRPLRENELSFQSAIQCSIGKIFYTMYQSVTCATSERKFEPEQEAEPSASKEECKPSGHFQTQSFSSSIYQGIRDTSNKFQSITFNANRRLRDLIQMACSLLYDTELNRERRERTTKRISILTDLIPTESTKDKSSFDCRLVQFVTAVLQEMDEKYSKAKEWAFEEALKHSQISGTFRNALSRRLDKILLPILAKIIALIDKNFNLTIIHDNRDSKKILSPIAKLWLEIFSERKLCRISYEEVFTTTNETKTKKCIPRIGASVSDHFYKCHFPFSWICREVINVQKRDSAVLAERYNMNHVKKMTELLESSPLAAILNSCVPNNDNEVHKKLCCFYLNDYILSTYKPTMVDEEKLVYDAVFSRFTQLSKDSSRFIEKLVVLHLAYAELEPQLQQFQQLISLSPKIVSSVHDKMTQDIDFKNEVSDLALCAVRVLLIDLKHNKDWDKDKTKQWVQNVSYYQNSINSILNLKTFYSSTDARKDWLRILALKTFAITIGLDYNNNNTLTALNQLTTFLKNPNFKSVKILKQVKLVLLNLQRNMKKSWNLNDGDFTNQAKQNEIAEYFKFIHCCEKYFIEIITNFCFEQTYDSKDPDSDMIDFLIDCIFSKESSTKSLTPFSERGDDAAPVVRSYLLQLLIGLKADYTWEKLENYFNISRSLAEENDTDLHVLCIQCFEDKHYKNIQKTTRAEDCLELLTTHVDEYLSVPVFTVRYFNSIASLRFCLSQFSDILYDWYTSDEKLFPKEWLKVLQTVEQLFNSPRGGYPAEYFIKYIVRHHCIQLFNHLKMCKDPSFDWVVPNHLKSKEENDEYVTNPAVVYCGVEESFFDKFSETLTLAVSSKDTTELEKLIQDINNPSYSVMILMAIYANMALKKAPASHEDQDKSSSKSSVITVANHANFSLYPSHLPQVVADYLKQFTANSSIFNIELKEIAKDMLHGVCRTNPNVIKMRNLQPKQLSGIIIHCVIVFHQKGNMKFLNPCIELLKNLSSMKDMYLPTMPEFCEFETDLQLMGAYYVCKNGHKFLVMVDDCENLDSEVKCSCQEKAEKDEKYRSTDEKATGHILGSADSRSKDEVLEGSKDEEIQATKLKAINCSILRIFLHTILTWSSSFIDKINPPNLDGCISSDVPVKNLEGFFLRHLEKDLIALSGLLDRSIDDAVLAVHLILKWISQLLDGKFPDYLGKWSSNEDRKKWEDDFSTLINPVTVKIDTMLRNTYDLAVKDTDTLYSKIFESTEESDSYSALWRYRTRLSLEHLSHSVKAINHKILDSFLKQEPILRAMQYLPGVLKLQKYLFDCFHQQIGQEKALSETIGAYKKTLQKGNKEMFDELVQGFNNAWLLLKHQLKNHGRLRVPSEYIELVPKITDDTKLAYLMPTITGEGICSSSMVDFLVCQHNEFIQFCYNNLPKTYYDPTICQKLLQNALPLSQLQASHVLNYEHKLIPVILTHCQYSLRYGKGTEVVYDFEAIERDLFDKFIFGKPLILLDEMPRVVFRKDAHDATFYESIMENVKQEGLQLEKKNSLVTEITKLNLHKLSELLDVVEIVLGFLASAGGNPNQRFHNYITKTLTMQRAHIPKAVKDCTLSTAISLWRIVSIVHSCKLTALGKNPFDRLDEVYCKPFEATKINASTVKTTVDDTTIKAKVDDKKRLSELQQIFKKIELPIDFLMGLHNFIAVFVSHRSPAEGCNPEWSMTTTWESAMESSCFYHKVDLKNIVINEDILMCHTAAVWKEAVGLLWPKEYQQ